MSGFVDSFAAKLAQRSASDHDPGLVMGYYNAADLPVYDHLVAEFCVCDRWFSSVPGATWPNRLYAIAGRADGTRDDKPSGEAPFYDLPAFVRHLDAHGVSWRWYSYDPATLRLADRRYRDFRQIGGKNFAYFDRKAIPLKERALKELVELRDSFLDDAVKSGTHGLRAVSAADMRQHLVTQAQRAFAPMAVIEVVLLVVALLSVGDTLAASVLRRLREIGTLRALGVRRGPVVRIVLVEALVIGALGLALGAGAGVLLGRLWIHRTLPHLLGWLLAFHFPWARGALVVLATVGVCLLAAILPARRAARLEPAMALRYE